MDMKEFAALLREAGEYVREKSADPSGVLCSLEVRSQGFLIYATKFHDGERFGFQRVVPFEEVFAAQFPLLKAAVDRVIANFAHIDHAA